MHALNLLVYLLGSYHTWEIAVALLTDDTIALFRFVSGESAPINFELMMNTVYHVYNDGIHQR